MTDNSAFTTQETPEQSPQPSAFDNQLKMIKNEEGSQKYDSVPKALDALAHSQTYIPQLKTENEAYKSEIEQLKTELASRAAVSEVVDKITAQQGQPETPPQVSGLDEQKAVELFQQMTAQQKQAEIASSNEASVSNALFQKFGDKMTDVVATKAQELGMTVDGLKSLAQSSPNAALQLFQVSGAPAPSATTGSVNIPPTTPMEEGLQPPTKSLLRGASTKEQVDYLKKIREDVYKKYDIQT
jgi:hypothetical protein